MSAWVVLVAAALVQTPVVPPGGVFTTIEQGTTTYVDMPRQVVVRTSDAWASLWKSHSPTQPVPRVDFSTTMVAAVFMGARPTAGFSTEILRVRPEGPGGGVVVEYKESEPRRGAISAQVVTAPYHIVAIPKRDGEVTFQKTEK